MADQPKCLCIVSRDRLRGGDFIAALGASLRPDDQLEIIVDRRSGEASDKWDWPEDRRQRPQVDQALKVNGFAVVPAPSPKGEGMMPSPRGERIMRGERTPLSLLLPSAPSSRLEPEYDENVEAVDDDDQERLEAIRSFKRERARGLAPWLVAALAVVAVAAFVLSPAGQAFKQGPVYRASPGVPGPASQPAAQPPETSPAPRVPAVAQAPPRAPASEAPPVERSTREPNSSAAIEPSPPPSRDTAIPSRDAAMSAAPRDTRALSVESSAPSRAATGTTARERARSTEAPRPSVSEPAPRQTAAVPAPAEPVPRLVSPRFAGLPRIELSREPGMPSGTYAVRIVDPAGKPLGDAEVLLLARMPDGTVENVRMDFFPDHGTYRGTLPPTRSSPLDLRVRVITGDKRVEIPLGP